MLYETASGTQTVLVPQSSSGFHVSISDDGRRVCYIYRGQVWIYDRAAGSGSQLGATPEAVNEAVISGDGTTVWEATALGRIVKLDVASGNAQEIVPRTPLITSMQGAPVPGSLNWLYGSGLSDSSVSAAPPLPQYLGGQSVLLNGTPARMLSVAPDALVYQIPFELPAGTAAVGVAANGSPFDPPPPQIEIQPYFPVAISEETLNGPCCGWVIAASDFSSLITQDNPALPGEVVHTYFTGLGQVSPPLASGFAAPSDGPSPVIQDLACGYYQSPGVQVPADVLFAGMAPGLVGIYQVDIRLPQSVSGLSNNPSQTSVLFTCGSSSSFDVWMNFGK